VKLLINRDGSRAPTAIHSHLGIKFHPLEKANAIADCLEKKFTPHDLCEENHKRQVGAGVQDLEAADIDLLKSTRPCDLQKLVNSLKLRKACEIDGIPNEGHWSIQQIFLTNAFGSLIFQSLGKKQK
jgi:hypothetical protein